MEPIIKEAWNESVAHVRPYIREVVEAFSPQLRVPLPMVETVRERGGKGTPTRPMTIDPFFLVLTMMGVCEMSNRIGRGWH